MNLEFKPLRLSEKRKRALEADAEAAVDRAMSVMAAGGTAEEALNAMDEGRELHEPAQLVLDEAAFLGAPKPAWGGMGYDGSRSEHAGVRYLERQTRDRYQEKREADRRVTEAAIAKATVEANAELRSLLRNPIGWGDGDEFAAREAIGSAYDLEGSDTQPDQDADDAAYDALIDAQDKIRRGDVVELLSGGYPMTVYAIERLFSSEQQLRKEAAEFRYASFDEEPEIEVAVLLWHDRAGKIRTDRVQTELLVRV